MRQTIYIATFHLFFTLMQSHFHFYCSYYFYYYIVIMIITIITFISG